MQNIDLEIKLNNLIYECEDIEKPIRLHEADFCDLLNEKGSNKINSCKLNEIVKLTNNNLPSGIQTGYYHTLKYETFNFFTVTTIPISEMNYKFC